MDSSCPGPSNPPNDVHQLPHLRQIVHPRSDDDFVLYNELATFESTVLSFSQAGDDDAVQQLEQQWTYLEARAEFLKQSGMMSDETSDLLDYVLDSVIAMLEDLEQNNSDVHNLRTGLDQVVQDIMKEVANEAAAQPGPSKPKKMKLSHPPAVPLAKKLKPHIQIRRLPLDSSKTERKRRVDSGIPGKESLKFRPCRDFFLENIGDPYPTASQKVDLQTRAGINGTSLNQWFTNTRRRSGWMDIMKAHAGNRKDEMKRIVDGVVADPNFPVGPEVKDAIMKMRKYIDEIAREVVGDAFLNDLKECIDATKDDSKRWLEEHRQKRKRTAQVIIQAPPPPPQPAQPAKVTKSAKPAKVAQPSKSAKPTQPFKLVRQDSNPRVGEKRKRGPEAFPLPPTKHLLRPPPRSKEPRLPGPRQHRRGPSSLRHSTVPEPDTETEAERANDGASDEVHVPPKDLQRRRLGVADLSASLRAVIPLSASSTLVGSELGEAHRSPSSSCGQLRSGSETLSSSDAEPEPSISKVVAVNLPKGGALIDPNEIPFAKETAAGQIPDVVDQIMFDGWINFNGGEDVHSTSFIPDLPSMGQSSAANLWRDLIDVSPPTNLETDFRLSAPLDTPVVPAREPSQDVSIPASSVPEGALLEFGNLAVDHLPQFDPSTLQTPSLPVARHPNAASDAAFAFIEQSASTPVASSISFAPGMFGSTNFPSTSKHDPFAQLWDSSAIPQIVASTHPPEWTIQQHQPLYYAS